MLSSHDRTDENGPTPAVSPSKKLSTFTAQDSVSIEWAVDTAASVSNDPVTALLADLKKVEVESLDSPQSSMTSLSGVYKVDTLVGLTNEGQPHNPYVYSTCSPSGVCLIVNNQVHLLNNGCSEHLATIILDDSNPQMAAYNRLGNFVVVGDVSGILHFVHVASKNIVFSQDLGNAEESDDQENEQQKELRWLGFMNRDNESAEELLVVFGNTLLRFSNVDLEQLDEALVNRDFALAQQVKAGISIEAIPLSASNTINDVFVFVGKRETDERIVVVGKGDEPVQVFRRSPLTRKTMQIDGVSRLLRGADITRVQVDALGKYMMTLEANGKLIVWDFKRLLPIYTFTDTAITTFSLLPLPPSPNNSHLVIVALTSTNYLQVVQLPSFIVSHTLKLSSSAASLIHKSNSFSSSLKKSTKSSQEDASSLMKGLVGFVENVQGKKLFVRVVDETVPLHKFQMLLKKKLFDDAKLFADEHGLGKDTVLRAKLSQILSDMNAGVTWFDEAESIESAFDALLTDLNELGNDSAVIDFCLQAILSSYDFTYKLLSFSRSITLAHGSVMAEWTVTSVMSALKRLGTFQLVQKTGKKPSSSSQSSFSGSEWQRFRSADMVVLCREYLRRGDIASASIIWRRHCLDDRMVDHVLEILQEMPDHASAMDFIPWLKTDIIPYVRKMEDRHKLSQWIESRSLIIEKVQHRPHQALAVMQLLASTTETDMDPLTISPASPAQHVQNTLWVAATMRDRKSGGGNADATMSGAAGGLKEQLEDLCYLWDTHDFQMSLTEYSQATPSAIALELLDRVAAAELLHDAIDKHFRPYVVKNGLNVDDLLVEYCLEMMDNAALGGTILSDAPWESRVIAILERIGSQDAQTDVILELMRRTPVPWSPPVDEVIRKSLKWTNIRRLEELREQYRLMKLKKMLLKYGIKVFNVADLTLAKGLVRYILSQTEIVDALDDALQVVNAYHHLHKHDAFVIRARHLVEKGLVERVCLVLKTGHEYVVKSDEHVKETEQAVDAEDRAAANEKPLSVIEATAIGKEVVSWIIEKIAGIAGEEKEKVAFGEKLDKSRLLLFLNAAMDVLRALLDLSVEEPDVHSHGEPLVAAATKKEDEELLSRLANVRSLLVDFDIVMDPKEYTNECCKMKHLRKAAEHVFLNQGVTATQTGKGKSKGKGGASSTPTPSASSSSSTEKRTSLLFRLSEVLGLPRSSLKGILAKEAARCGDVKTALVFCKELYEKHPDATTAKILRDVAHELTKYAKDNIQVFRDGESKSSTTRGRLTRHILQLIQQALSIAGEEQLCEYLDTFKNFEIQHGVFVRSDAGDYQAMAKQNADTESRRSPTLFQSSVGGSGSGSGSGSSSWSAGGSGSGSGSSSSSGSGLGSSASSYSQQRSENNGARAAEMEIANLEDRFANELFEDQFSESGLVMSTEEAMELTTSYTVSNMSGDDEANDMFDVEDSTRRKAKNVVRTDPVWSGKQLMDYLKRMGNVTTSIKVWHRLMESILRNGSRRGAMGQTPKKMDTLDVTVYHKMVETILSNVFSSRAIDQTLALALLLYLPFKSAFMVFKSGMGVTHSLGRDFSRLIRFANIGMVAGVAWNQRSFIVECQNLASNARWWQQFRLLDIPVDDIQFKNDDYRRQLVSVFLKKTGLDVMTVLDYARSYRIEDDYVIFEYVRQLLLSQDEKLSYQNRIVGILDDVTNKERFMQLLETSCAKISPYEYEKLRFVFATLQQIDKTHALSKRSLLILDILINYTRTVPPTRDELVITRKQVLDASTRENEDMTALMEIFPKSARRLPFHEFLVVKETLPEILASELSSETLPRLLSLTVPLEISSDEFYLAVIRKLASKAREAYESARRDQAAGIDPTETDTSCKIKFADFRTLLTKVKNLKFAIQESVYIAGCFPSGADRANLYKLGIYLNNKWMQEIKSMDIPDKQRLELCDAADISLENIKTFYARTENETLLRSHKFTSLLPIASKPMELIRQLYDLKSQDSIFNEEAADIHGMTAEIAKRHGLDIEAIRRQLLEEWLAQDLMANNQDKYLYLPSSRLPINNVVNTKAETAQQWKILYLLQCYPLSESVRLLATVAMKPSAKVPLATRVRALSVLFQAASTQELEKAKMRPETLRECMQLYLYLADFEELGIVISTSEFKSCDKEALVRRLWVNNSDDAKVLQLICNICLDYSIHDLTLWENCVQKLVSVEAYKYVLGILEYITSSKILSRMSCLPRVWNDVLVGCLQILSKGNEEDAELQSRILSLIQKCPILQELSMEQFVDTFVKVGTQADSADMKRLLFALQGLCLLPYSEQGSKATEKLVQQVSDTEKLLELLNVLDGTPNSSNSKTVATFATRVPIIEAVYRFIESNQMYNVLSGTTHLTKFTSFLIRNDQIENLLIVALKSGRTPMALDLMPFYYRAHPTQLPELEDVPDATVEDFSKLELLKHYILTHTFGSDLKGFIQTVLKKIDENLEQQE